MILTTIQLKAIATSGGGLVLDASTLTYVQLKELCLAASVGGGSLMFKHCGDLTGDQLIALARIAPKLVVFDHTP